MALPSMVCQRWLALVAGLYLQACGGNTYSFGIWSGAFKDRMGYSQQLLNALGTAKDVGDNVGVIAGTLYDYLPIWALLLWGSAQNILGYGGLWLAASGRAPKPPFWLACVLICVGTNGATFFQTAAIVTLVRNFPSHRGAVVGLTKGFVGLSGAIFTQIYYAAFAPNQTSFLFLIAVVPPLLALFCANIVRPIPPTKSEDEEEEEHSNFLTIYLLGFFLAAFLLVSIVWREVFRISHPVNVAITTAMVLILTSLLLVPAKEHFHEKRHPRASAGDLEERGTESVALVESSHGAPEIDFESQQHLIHLHDEGDNWLDVENRAESIAYGLMTEAGEEAPERTPRGSQERLPRAPPEVSDVEQRGEGEKRWSPSRGITEESDTTEGAGELEVGCYRMPRIGMDHGVLESFATLDFWVLFLSTMCGAGSGLTAINNLAQVGASLGAGDSVGAFVSLISIWSFLGRMGAGLVSEHYVRKYGTPRPVFSLITQAIMGLGHLLFASALPGSLYVGSLIVGLCYGAQWTLMPAIASELFGLAHFGAIMAWQSVASPSGSYILSVLVAGYLYDMEADRQSHVPHPTAHPVLGGTDFSPYWGAINETQREGGLTPLGRRILNAGFPGESLGSGWGFSWMWTLLGGSSVPGGSRLGTFLGGASKAGGSLFRALLGGYTGEAVASKACMGARCFRLTFIIMAGVCLFGVCLNIWLSIRTREYYRGVWKEHVEKMANRESEKGSVAGDSDVVSDAPRT